MTVEPWDVHDDKPRWGPVVLQVGGTHYAPADAYGHWDLVEEFDIAYLEAQATRYVLRWRKKNGREDLEKALSFLQKMGGRPARRLAPFEAAHRVYVAMGSTYLEQVICNLVLVHGDPDSISQAIDHLSFLMGEPR
jgi:hypothetical protein